ncbi:AAEL007000-PA [Aedes aegypti]|uniref:BTB domain-containing protein n=2 Tax=Aedes aegypti TaxID=7159 RepID=A0A8W7IIY8_AEDAE|nr:uncharacterized protein LOC5568644 isoform X3 [Aedes aegypti]XP_021700329.1 uncharacterized protein LOC5568644 isoform X3 [Aedes aegypti]EAT41332.1 AAEL007000-PA [Aedes aegypti]
MQHINAGFPLFVKDLFDDRSLSDVTIVVDNDEKSPNNIEETVAVQAHRLVLAVMSGYFQKAFCDNSSDDNRLEIRLVGVPYSIFQKCLKFMYHGFDETLSNMTLEDGIKFYSIAKMLEMDTKVKQSYSKWITKNLGKWEQQIWSIFLMAVERELNEVVVHCKAYVTDIANELLFFDAFRTMPLSIVQMVLSDEKMNCTKSELKKAIKCWISSNQIDEPVANELLNSIQMRKDPLFKGEEAKFYKSMRVKETEAGKLNSSAPDTAEHRYESSMYFLKNIVLTGITVFFKRNPDSTKSIDQNATGNIELELKICPFYIDYGASVSRTAVVMYDLTQRNAHKVNIFFPELKCSPFSKYRFEIKWKGEGLQPLLHMFGPIAHDLVKADESLVWSMFYKQPVENNGARVD